MKKNFYLGFIALIALTVTSCSNDDVVMQSPDVNKAIEFGTYLGRDAQSRGTIMNDNALKAADAGFGVLAYYTNKNAWASANTSATPNFMHNQLVKWNNSAWEYSPIKYWPTTQGDKITFFAYAPMASTSNGITISGNSVVGTPTVTYTIDLANLENMGDFVADALIDQTRQTSEETLDDNDEPVTFVLNHELTRVNIQAKLSANAFGDAAANKTKVNITDIKFTGTGFATTGTYTFANVNDVAADATAGTAAETIRGTWSYTSVGTSQFSIFDTNNTDANFVKKAAATELGTYQEVGVSVPTTETVNLFAANQYLFLIPANGETGIGDDKKVSMYVSYDIVTADANLSSNYSKTSAVKEIVLPDGLLKQGTAYNILLTFGMNEIKLSASVAEWGTVDNSGNANVDYPKTDK